MSEKLNVLFLCTGNSCRSQMAEGWAHHLISDQITAYSAGIEKHGMNQLAVRAMAEAGIDIGSHASKTVDELPVQNFDIVITLCGHANETCPFIPGQVKRIHVGFDDPPRLAKEAKSKEEAMVHYRRVCEEIRDLVNNLPEQLNMAK